MTFTIFNHIPSQKAALIWLALKFGFRDDSVSIVTEGLGPQPFHGKVALLVDESTTGAGERSLRSRKNASWRPWWVRAPPAGSSVAASTK